MIIYFYRYFLVWIVIINASYYNHSIFIPYNFAMLKNKNVLFLSLGSDKAARYSEYI